MILIPKRKVSVETPDGEALQSIIEHTTEIIYDTIETSRTSMTTIADFSYLCKIPIGTDKYI